MKPPRRTWALDTAVERVRGGIVIAPEGRIGSRSAAVFAAAIAAARVESPRMVIDLQGVDYISGPGIEVLLAMGSPNDGRVIVCGLREAVRITLELSGVLNGLTIEDTRAAALSRLQE